MLTIQMIALWGHQFHIQPMNHWTDSLYSMLQQFHMDYLYQISDISVPCLYKKWTAERSEYSGYGLLGCDAVHFVRLVRARLHCEEVTDTIWDRLWIVPMAVDTVEIVLLMVGVCAARNMYSGLAEK